MNKIVLSLGVVAVVGLMAVGVAYAVMGTEGQARSEGGYGGRRASEPPAAGGWRSVEGSGEPLAPAEATQRVVGVVASVDGSLLVVETSAGELVEVSLGRTGYWETQAPALMPGEAVVIEGFYEDEESLAASSVTIVSSGETVVLREASGRPMWAGGRRGAGAAWALEES